MVMDIIHRYRVFVYTYMCNMHAGKYINLITDLLFITIEKYVIYRLAFFVLDVKNALKVY